MPHPEFNPRVSFSTNNGLLVVVFGPIHPLSLPIWKGLLLNFRIDTALFD
jgi:hypothetical protein